MIQTLTIETLQLIFNFEKNPKLDKLKEIIKAYRDEKFPINERFDGQITLLHVKQSYRTMKYLLDIGGNPNVSGYYEIKPIHLQENYKTIKLLVERGAQPGPIDTNNFNPLFWQKDPESIIYLLQYNHIYTSRIIPVNNISHRSPYLKMLIHGGYDPYSEYNISVSPVFLQRNTESFRLLMNISYLFNFEENFYDMAYETMLFKSCINSELIHKCKKIFIKDDLNNYIDHQNVLGNTALHVQYIPENITALLENGADWTIKNNNDLNPIEYHLERHNIIIAKMIIRYSSAKIIQRCWRKFWFTKNFIPPKYFKVKKNFLFNFILLPPSECHIFPGGIEYQKAYEVFKQYIS